MHSPSPRCRLRASARRPTALWLIVAVSSCCELAGTLDDSRSIALLAGDGQNGVVGEPVALAPSVRLTNQRGDGVAGVVVTFAVIEGGGAVAGATQTTDPAGIATAGTWTLGSVPGVNRLTATAAGTGISGNPATFTAQAVAGPPAAVVVQAGDNQQTPVGQPVPVPPAVLVRDQFGNPAAGAQVTFVVGQGGGTVAGGSSATGPTGVAAVGGWTLGPTPGPNTLIATVTGDGIAGNPVTFTAIGIGQPQPAPPPPLRPSEPTRANR